MDEPSVAQNNNEAVLQRTFSLPDRPQTRAAGFALTMAAHLALLAAFLFGIRVAAPVVMDAKPLAVSIEKHMQEPRPILAMKPRLSSPRAIQVPVPEFTIQQPVPSPVVATYAPSVTAGAGKGGTDAGTSMGCASCYLKLIHDYLLAFFVYPPEGARRHLQGVVTVHFIADRAGNLISFEVLSSSGHPILDEAALDLMRKAGKIPPIPADLPIDRLNTRIPIVYMLVPDPEDLESSASSGRTGRFGR